MAKYHKFQLSVEVVPFEKGMEDGYASYDVFSGQFHGFFEKGRPVPRNHLIPAIKNAHGWFEVKEGDYIVTEQNGVRYPESKEAIDECYELIEEEMEK